MLLLLHEKNLVRGADVGGRTVMAHITFLACIVSAVRSNASNNVTVPIDALKFHNSRASPSYKPILTRAAPCKSLEGNASSALDV